MNDSKGGRGRLWFAVLCGGLACIASLATSPALSNRPWGKMAKERA